MNKLSTLFAAAKSAPVKTTAIVLGTTAAVAGTVYGVKKFRQHRQNKAEGTEEAVVSDVKKEEKADA